MRKIGTAPFFTQAGAETGGNAGIQCPSCHSARKPDKRALSLLKRVMNRLIRYGLYFVVAFSVLAFGAAEVWAFSVVEFVVFFLIFLVVAGGLSKQVVLRKRGAAVWIPVALFVLLVLVQMVPLRAGVLKVVSPATYELYEETGFRVQGSGFIPVESLSGSEKVEVEREWRSISINRHGTFRMLLKFLAYAGVFFLVVYYRGRERISIVVGLIWAIFFVGLFNAIFSFLQGMSGGQIQWLTPLAPPGEYLGTFKSPNNFSEFLEMVIPLTMGLLIAQNYLEVKKFSRRLGAKMARMAALFSKTGLLSFGIIVLIPALFLSLCRGGFVTFPLTILITIIFMVVSYRLHDRYSFVLFGMVVVGGFGFLLWMGIGPVIEEMMTIFNPGSRPITYSDAIEIIKDFPLFGVGFGNWHDIIMKYHTLVGSEKWMPAIAYNDTLQITVETGFAGLACVTAFLFMIYKRAIQALKRGGDVVSQALILGGITAMTAALIHCQVDYLFVLPSNAVVFMAIAGATYRLSE